MSSPSAALRVNDPVSMLAKKSTWFTFIAIGTMGLAIMSGRRKRMYKIPIKLAALLLCFYGSALAVSSHTDGLPALVPYCLITFALLLVIFW